MKAKGIYSVIAGLTLFLIAGAVSVASGNVLLGLVSIPVSAYVFQGATGLQLFDMKAAAFVTLASIPRSPQQVANPGGARRLFLCATDNFVGEWPGKTTITDGEITAAPTLVAGPPVPTFIEVQVSDNSLKIDQSLKGATGYQSYEQMLEVKIAGYNKTQCAAIEKLLNTEVVACSILNDGQRVVSGTSFLGLQFEITHSTGAKGSDRREWTLKAKQDGYMHGYLPLADSVTIPGVGATV